MQSPDGDLLIPGRLVRTLALLAFAGGRELERQRKRDGGGRLPDDMFELLGLLGDLTRLSGEPAFRSVGPWTRCTCSATWVSTGDAALIARVGVQHVRRLARAGRLISKRVGRDWLIDRQAAEDYGKDRRSA